MNDGLYTLDITDEDLNVTEKWLIKVEIIEVEEIDEDDEVYVKRKFIFEIIDKYAPNVDVAMELGYEISKIPVFIKKKDWRRMVNGFR